MTEVRVDIPISKFKVWNDWRGAPLGAILIIKSDGGTLSPPSQRQCIVLRTEYREPGKPTSPTFVALLGTDAGRLRFGGQIGFPAIDVSELVVLQITEALLTPANQHSVDAGGIYSAGSDAVPLMFVVVPDLGNGSYVALVGNTAGQNTQATITVRLGALQIIDKATEKPVATL